MTFNTLESPIRWLFLFHALAGTIALAVFSIPLFSKKGGKVHIRAGWVYICAMCFVALSAFIITPWRAIADPSRTPHSQGFAVFLFFISVLTVSSIWFGMSALKHKTRNSPDRSLARIGPGILLIVCGIQTQIIGYILDNYLLMIFPFLGYVTGIGQIKYWLGTPIEKRHWWYAHLRGMGIACITTVTAFLVTALPKIIEGSAFESPILWIAPGVFGGILMSRAEANYRNKFGDNTKS